MMRVHEITTALHKEREVKAQSKQLLGPLRAIGYSVKSASSKVELEPVEREAVLDFLEGAVK